MRLISFPIVVAFALLSPAALAQQPAPKPAGEAIGHPPPLPGPPPVSQSTAPPAAAPAPQAGAPAQQKGYIGAYAPASENSPPPYYKGPLPTADTSAGLNVVASDGVSTKTVKAVRCSTAARETDGTTTCVGIPDESTRRKRR